MEKQESNLNNYTITPNDYSWEDNVIAERIEFHGRSIVFYTKDDVIAIYPYKDIIIKKL
jgi:hypothetical protein